MTKKKLPLVDFGNDQLVFPTGTDGVVYDQPTDTVPNEMYIENGGNFIQNDDTYVYVIADDKVSLKLTHDSVVSVFGTETNIVASDGADSFFFDCTVDNFKTSSIENFDPTKDSLVIEKINVNDEVTTRVEDGSLVYALNGHDIVRLNGVTHIQNYDDFGIL